jgi:hypothetical protein
LTREEYEGLTIHGDAIAAQFREHGSLALQVQDGAPRDVDGPVLLSPGDVAKLHALLVAGVERGAW